MNAPKAVEVQQFPYMGPGPDEDGADRIELWMLGEPIYTERGRMEGCYRKSSGGGAE